MLPKGLSCQALFLDVYFLHCMRFVYELSEIEKNNIIHKDLKSMRFKIVLYAILYITDEVAISGILG